MTREEYTAFVAALNAAEKVEFHECGTCGNQNRIGSAPCRMDRAAVIQGADIDMDRGRRRLIRHHRAAQGSIQRDSFVKNGYEPRRRPASLLRSGNALLPEGDFRT